MAFDVFVSYAHVDNEPLPPATEGWVSTFARVLQARMAQKLGRAEAFELFIDEELSGNALLTPQLLDRIREAATLVIVYSAAYRSSEWCNREKNTFLQLSGALGSRLFVVERDKVDREPELADLLGYKFWIEDTLSHQIRTLGDPELTHDDQRLYYGVLGDLANDLARELHRQRGDANGRGMGGDGARVEEAIAPATHGVIVAPTADATVFLAEVTDDLEPQRDEVRRFLEQLGVHVVPSQTYLNRSSIKAFNLDVEKNLASCTLFVELLSGVAGKRPSESDHTFVELQFERAQTAGMPILQWRDPGLDVSRVLDKRIAALLQRDTVFAVGLEEFKREVFARSRPRPPAPTAAPAGLVFVNAQIDDFPFARQLSEFIKNRCGAEYVLPLERGDPAELRRDLEQNLLDCDRLMIVYGATAPEWVREQLRIARKVLARRERALRGLAVCYGPPPPPPEKTPLNFELLNQRTIDGSARIDEDTLRAFVAQDH